MATTPTQPFHTGRVPNQDPRSLAHPARTATDLRTVTHRRYGPTLDQGATSACTGHALVHALNTRPLLAHGAHLHQQTEAFSLYSKATTLDPFPWTYPPEDGGSSVLAIAKAAKQAGLISGYSWAFGLDHTLAALTLGPVVVGTVWRQDMFYPDKDGRVSLTGKDAGGHCYMLQGLNTRHRTVTCQNSWGKEWGKRGRFILTWDQLGDLLADGGDSMSLNPTA